MAALTAKDILTFLDGNASPELLHNLQVWAESKPKRALKLARYQKIYDEFSYLREHKLLDGEYEKFQLLIASSSSAKSTLEVTPDEITDLDILRYVSGHQGPQLTRKIEEWTGASEDNAQSLAKIQNISTEGGHLDTYRKFNSRLEYEDLKKIIARRKEKVIATPAFIAEPTIEHKEEQNRSALWPILLALALLLGLAYGAWYFWNKGNANKTIFVTTEELVKDVEISDGSQITLGENSKLEYFSNAKQVNQREVKLDGTGEFNIAFFQQKTFKAYIENEIIVNTQTSNFIIEDSSPYRKVIRNSSGALMAYLAQDSSVNVNIAAGEAYGFDGKKFIKIVKEVDTKEEKEYPVLYVIDHLMQNSDWRVTTAPYKTIRKSDKVSVDLDQPYESILNDLVRSSDFAYEDMECEGCYRITRFAAR